MDWLDLEKGVSFSQSQKSETKQLQVTEDVADDEWLFPAFVVLRRGVSSWKITRTHLI